MSGPSGSITSRLQLGPGALRYLLALAVVFFHGSLYFPIGRTAVYVFFVLSGYWMSRMYERVYARASLSTYLLSRAARLLPTYFATFALTLGALLIYARASGAPLDESVQRLRDPSTLLRNLMIFGLDGHEHLALLVPAWSLDIELQFYAALPGIVWLRKRFGTLALIGLFGLSMLAVAISHRFGYAVYLFRYLGFFLVGMALSRSDTSTAVFSASARNVATLIAAALFVAPYMIEPYGQAVIFDKSAQWLGKYIWELHNLALAVLLIPLVDHNVRGDSTPRDRKLGDMSYALYLAHWGTLLMFKARWGMAHSGDDALELLAFAACSCAAGWLVYQLVDARCERLRRAWLARKLARTPT